LDQQTKSHLFCKTFFKFITFTCLITFFLSPVSAAGNYYDVLGVPRDADERTIKKKFYELARQHHPDRNEDSTEELIAQLNTAYETLISPEKRQEYDNELLYGPEAFLGSYSRSRPNDENSPPSSYRQYEPSYNAYPTSYHGFRPNGSRPNKFERKQKGPVESSLSFIKKTIKKVWTFLNRLY